MRDPPEAGWDTDVGAGGRGGLGRGVKNSDGLLVTRQMYETGV